MSRLHSKYFRILPNQKSREFHINRNRIYTPEKFESYVDWFYFIHIDPYTRWIHALGMLLGLVFYTITAYHWWMTGFTYSVATYFLSGAFFFYFVPLLSHSVYDGGGAKSTPSQYHSTFIPVIHINLLTLTGQYNRWLTTFIEKYPFTVQAWQLEEK